MKQFMIAGIYVLLVGTVSCKKAVEAIDLPRDVQGPQVTIDSFPLHVGNQWTYKVISQTSDGTLQEPVSATFSISSISTTTVNGIQFSLLKTVMPPSPFLKCYFYSGYFCNLPDGLHQYPDTPKLDSTTVIDTASLKLKFPVKIDSYWGFSSIYSTIYQSWSGYVKVTTPAGTFNCIKLSFGGGGGMAYHDLHVDQYFSKEGLIQEVSVDNYMNGSRNNNATTKNIIILQSTNVK
jgi:hypothetical protein